MQFLFMLLSMLTAIFLILLVLVQRGRGGGLTGALGGMGGQSAFGSKAGDLFTRITIGVAAFWIVLSVASIKVLNTPETVFGDTETTTSDDSSVPSLSTDTTETLPETTSPDLGVESGIDASPGEPAPEATESATSPDAAAPATTEEATPAADASAEPEPAAASSATPAATESTEATPAKAATPEENE